MATFNENLPLFSVYTQSLRYYKSKKVDDKKARAKIDVKSAKIVSKNNFEYDKSTKSWKQTGRSSKLELKVKTQPTSYDASDTIKNHVYPIIFEFKDITLGGGTPFRWRDGSQKKPIFYRPGFGKTASQVANENIRNGVQLQFFFELEFVSRLYGTLWGVCRANRLPLKTNPKKLLYFSKHDIFALEKIIFPFLNSEKGLGRFTRPVGN